MANLDNLQDQIALFNVAYAERFKSPEVLATLLKTLTSHNITIEDWNTLVDTLQNNLELSPKMSELFNTIAECLDEVYETLEALPNKVDKSNEEKILYGTNENGTQNIYYIEDGAAIAGTIVQRNEDGHVVVGSYDESSFNDNEAITKAHLEDRLNSKVSIADASNVVYGKDSEGEETRISYSDTANDSLIKRKADGSIYLGTAPTYTTDAANKQYVDGAIAQAIENVNANSYVVIDIEEYPSEEDFLEGFPADEGIIYLYPLDTSEAPDFESGYKQYIWENSNWLFIGKTIIDLSNYWQKNSDIDVGQHTVTAKDIHIVKTGQGGDEANINIYNQDTYISTRGGNIVISPNEHAYYAQDASDPSREIATFGTVVKHQVSTIFIINPLTNISGRAFQNFTSEDVTVNNHPAVKILKNSTAISEEDAAMYMEYMTGSLYVPKYNYDKPKYTYFIDPNGQVYKPQWDSTNGLLLYKMSIVATKSYVDSTKVAKTSSGEKVYGTDELGAQTTYDVDSDLVGDGAIVRRNTPSGTIVTGTPTSNTHATTKAYVDTSIANAISNVYKYIGTKTVAQLNALSGSALHTGDVYNVSDSGTLTSGSVQVIPGDNVAWTGTAWDKLANDIDWTEYNETFMAAGFIQAGPIDSVPEQLTFDFEGNITNPDWTGNIALDYMSPPISDISISDVPATLTFDVTQDYNNMITNADWTGIMTITY